MVPKYFINLTRQFVLVIQQSVGRAVILKYNPTWPLSITAAPCLCNRADEYLISEESWPQV